ncbi:helix-turn-helix transcriptional regulator [Streptosporangium sp. NPDC004631]
MTQLTYFPTQGDAVEQSAWTPAPEDVHTLRHGYNLADLHQLATRALWRVWGVTVDRHTRYELAWSAIAEAIYAASDDQPPSPVQLIGVGQDAIGWHVRAEARHHGLSKHAEYDPMRGFAAYWEIPVRHAGSPEPGVVDRLALWQIWPELTDAQRKAVLALAAFGTYQAAAGSLGITYKTFKQHIGDARRRFLTLWHEGEQPSRIWGADRRVHRSGDAKTEVSYRNAVKSIQHGKTPQASRKKTELDHGKVTTYNNHKCRCAPCTEAKRIEGVNRRARAGITPRKLKARPAAEQRVTSNDAFRMLAGGTP